MKLSASFLQLFCKSKIIWRKKQKSKREDDGLFIDLICWDHRNSRVRGRTATRNVPKSTVEQTSRVCCYRGCFELPLPWPWREIHSQSHGRRCPGNGILFHWLWEEFLEAPVSLPSVGTVKYVTWLEEVGHRPSPNGEGPQTCEGSSDACNQEKFLKNRPYFVNIKYMLM